MRAAWNGVMAAMAAAVLGCVMTPAAYAGCGVWPGMVPAAAMKGGVAPAFYQPAEKGLGEILSDLDALERMNDPIVGMWKEQFIAPDGKTLIDNGYSQWHGDGTEILNSSRPPMTSSFCLGVWKKVGARKYRLNHYAFNWDAVNVNTLNGTANIREEVTVDASGNTFTGTFTIDFYGTNGLLVQSIPGTIKAERLTVNSPGNS